MKHNLKYLSLLLLFLSSLLSSLEYDFPTNNIPETKVQFDIPKSSQSPQQPFQSGTRDRRLQRMLQQTSSINCAHSTQSYQTVSALQYVQGGFQNQRQNLIEQFTNNNPNIHATYCKKYYIPEISKQYLAAHNIDIGMFQSCEGNLLQHTIHQEFIVLTDTTAHIWNECRHQIDVQQLTSTIADFASAGISFNHIGEVQKAMSLADAGWAMLDCIQAAGEGAIAGLFSIGNTILHPIQSAQNYAHAITTCGYYCGIALKEISHFIGALESDQLDLARNKYLVLGDQCKNIAQALGEQCKDLQLRDVIKTATQWAIESYATTRAFNGFSNFFKHAQHNAAQIAKKISHGAQESTLLMSAEGIPVRMAQEVITQAKKIPTSNDKLLQLLSKFEGKKIK